MPYRREGPAIVRDPFDPAAPGDYAAPPEAVRAVRATLAGTGPRLYDPRAREPLDAYHVFDRRDEGDRGALVLRHRTLEHALDVQVHVRAVEGTPSTLDLRDVLLTFLGALAMEDPQDRGALVEWYTLVDRRDEGDAEIVRVRHRRQGHVLDVVLRVAGRPPEEAYRLALDQDEVWRRGGHVVYDERHPRPRP